MSGFDNVLTALEKYLELKKNSTEELPVTNAREEAGGALNDYIQKRFDTAMLEERRRSLSVTKKVAVVNPSQVKVTWDEVAKLLDALNNSPLPLKEPKQMFEKDFIRWMEIYTIWYQTKRLQAMQLPSASLELDLDESTFNETLDKK